MAESEVNQIIEEQWYPKGSSLDADKKKLAQTVFRPDQVDKWLEKGINRSDLQGYDTPDAREPSQKVIMGSLRKQGVVGYVESEPERFLRPNQETRKLLEAYKGSIINYKTFKEAVQKAWDRDKSLPNLIANMDEKDFQALFNTKQVQTWLEGNTGETIITTLMQKYHIDRARAKAIHDRLEPSARSKLLEAMMLRRPMRVAPAAEPTPEARPVAPAQAIRQRTREGGRLYSRSKPRKWQELEVSFIRNNRSLPTNTLFQLYNTTFTLPRTLSSIKTKRQRLAM